MSRLGLETPVSPERSCGYCEKYDECDDPRKRWAFSCSRFKFDPLELEDVPAYDEAPAEIILDEPKVSARSNEKFLRSIERLIEADSRVPLVAPINEADVPIARNYIQWARGKDFLHLDPEPFAKHFQFGLLAFSEYCPHCSNKDYVYNIPKLHDISDIRQEVQELEYGVCPRCKRTQTEMILEGSLGSFRTVALLLGQRSSKSTWVGEHATTYMTHRMLTLPDPSRYFNLRADQLIHGTFVALDFTQVLEMWNPYLNTVTNAPWFENYRKLLAEAGNEMGRELYKQGEMSVLWRHKSFMAAPHAPDKRRLRGRTRFFTAPDELGLYDMNRRDKVKTSAEEIYESLNNSLATLQRKAVNMMRAGRNNIPMALNLCISSGMSDHDMMSKLVRASRDNPTIYGVKLPTWDVNPDYSKEDVEREFGHTNWKRDFGCIFGSNEESYFRTIDHLRDTIIPGRRSAALLRPRNTDIVGESGSVTRMLTADLEWRWHNDTVPKVMILDAGWRNNSYAMSVGHYEKSKEGIDAQDTVVVDLVGELIPRDDRDISYHGMLEHVILPVIDKMNVKLVVSDLWNSIFVMQEIERKKRIETILNYRVDYSAYTQFREETIAGLFRMPMAEVPIDQISELGMEDYRKAFFERPIAHMMYQAISCHDDGATVDKPTGGTDDVLRTMVLLRTILRDPDFNRRFVGHVDGQSNKVAYQAIPQKGVLVDHTLRSNRELVAGTRTSQGTSTQPAVPIAGIPQRRPGMGNGMILSPSTFGQSSFPLSRG